jgi:hypothetical protein
MCLDSGPSVSHKYLTRRQSLTGGGRIPVNYRMCELRRNQLQPARAEVPPIAIAVRRLMNCPK